MIPKIIHYCWFGRKPKPEKVIEFINTWKKHCPDYEIIEWNEDNFDVNQMPFTKEAYKTRKYAFVSDVCRLFALIKFGGIYLDTDVRVLKSFDDYINYKSFIGKEFPFKVSTAVIGSERDCKWLKLFYESYNNKHFITKYGFLNKKENTAILTQLLNRIYPDYVRELEIFDIDVFCGKLYVKKEYMITERTVTVHEFAGTWINSSPSLLERTINLFKRVF